IEKFLDNAVFDALCSKTGEIIFMRKDSNGIFQLYLVKENSENPELEKVCISEKPKKTIGIERAMLPLVHKGASDWHPSGKWFITQVEIPYNISWKYKKRLPGTRLLAEPGAGWWNNLFLVKRDGSLWIKLTDFTPFDLKSGVLYPKFSEDGNMISWAERIGGAKPFDKYPFAKWVLKIAKINMKADIPYLYNIKTYPLKDGTIFEPQDWFSNDKLLFAGDIGYSELPYPAYRIDLWEAEIDSNGNIKNLKNLTETKDFYEEQASYSPDGRLIALMANQFDLNYTRKLMATWKIYGSKFNSFITKHLKTELYIMNPKDKVLTRLTHFSEKEWGDSHPLVTRSAWSKDGKTIFIALTLRSNLNGKKTGNCIYRIKLKD
ncbi:hypothetical protein NLC30_04230, partial [Candidatus Aminicenantes bacterium AC-334-E05]|nr:hypothetical protein [Candidatus Aminicenantes bacterium AC-334-E05]